VLGAGCLVLRAECRAGYRVLSAVMAAQF